MRIKEVKFFIVWMPVPDPFYHSPRKTPYYKPERFKKILPSKGIKIDGYMVSLNHLIRDKGDMHVNTRITDMMRKSDLRKFFGFREIFIDSGAFQLKYYKRANECKKMSLNDIFRIQVNSGAAYICHFDSLGNVEETVRSAYFYKKFEDQFLQNYQEVYYVIQGNTISEYLLCLRKLLKIGCERFALGNLYNFRREYGSEGIINLIKTVRNFIHGRKLHLLGVGDIKIITCVIKEINSFDTALPIKSATLGKTAFWINENYEIKKIKIGTSEDVHIECKCPVCKKFNVLIDEQTFPKYSGIRMVIRHLRAIHNAYVIREYLNLFQENV